MRVYLIQIIEKREYRKKKKICFEFKKKSEKNYSI